MKLSTALILLAVVTIGSLIANLIALKIAADQASAQLDGLQASNPLLSLFASKK